MAQISKKHFGYIPSKITSETAKFNAPSMALPKEYSYKKYLPDATNQGSDPYCIPHSVAAWLNWRINLKKGLKKDYHINYKEIFKNRIHDAGDDGMTYQDAFNYLKTHGVSSDKGILKIAEAASVPSIMVLKTAIVLNGPCFAALPVYDSSVTEFWKNTTNTLEAWHSITVVGYDEKGFIIRNSWGTSYGKKGYAHITYEDAKLFREIWTILG